MRGSLQPHSPDPSGNLRTHTPPTRTYREIFLVAVFILFSSLTFLLIQYDRFRSQDNGLEIWIHSMLHGAEPAPEQYRIGMAFLPHLLQTLTPLNPHQTIPLIEFLSYAGALTLLYFLFRSSPHVVHARPPNRIVLLGFFLAALQFPILWIFPWERPETLPTAFYLAAIVFLVVQRSRMRFAIVCVLALLLSLGQAFMRADAPVAVGIALFIAAILAIPLRRPRAHIAILGTLCSFAGAGVQLYLQRVAFPNATYPPGVPKFQLLHNLNPLYPPAHIPIFLTALLPFLVTLALIRRNHLRIDASDKLVLIICFVYLPVWIIVGLIGETRIFVPYLLLAAPTMAKLWAAFLLDEGTAAPHLLSTPPLS